MEDTAVTGMEAIITAIGSVTEVVGEVFTVMTSNPLITFFLAVSVLGTGIGVFHKLKRG